MKSVHHTNATSQYTSGCPMVHTRRGLPLLLTLLLAYVTAPAFADADLRVRIFDRGGSQPLPGVSVCLGTPASLSQFGSSQTDASGYVRFTGVPRAPLVVTASRPGYKGEQQSLVTSSSGSTLVISMVAGGGGPVCEHQGQMTGGLSGGLNIGYFRVINRRGTAGGRDVVLSHSVNREPTHFRVSESADFRGAAWQPYTAEPGYRLSQGAGYKVVYFQVRRHSTMGGEEVEILSPVVQDVILLQ